MLKKFSKFFFELKLFFPVYLKNFTTPAVLEMTEVKTFLPQLS